ncbi:ATL2 [Symbiodinium natans]|uniref:ATL2 protein n=1 Tax=Symbiodinium natans TaxID=878477 RepID=A0A812UL11_9DINO|nr:ATL2 [Symbiodinium natans]
MKGADNTPLKILELKPESSEVEILKDNLDKISVKLNESGASYVSIIAVMGTYRTGKSFLLDLLARYLKKKAAKEAAQERALEKAQLDALTQVMAVLTAVISLLPAALAQQQAGGSYQRYLDQYAGDYNKYIGSGGSAGGSGFGKYYQKYMDQYSDYTKYMNGGRAGGNGYESFLSQYAGNFMSGDKAQTTKNTNMVHGPTGPTPASPVSPVALVAADQHAQANDGHAKSYMDFQRYLQGHGSESGDFSHYMNQYAGNQQKAEAAGSETGGFSNFMDQYASDYQQYMRGHGSPGHPAQGGASFAQYMDQYADFQKYMQGQDSHGGQYGKYFKQYTHGQGSPGSGDYQQFLDFQHYSGQGGDFSKFMNEYASDYSKYMGHGSQSQGSHGSQAEDFMAQYADYTKYMQRMQQGGSPGESYMAQYMGQDGQTSQGGGSDYSKFMDQYASGFANMGQGSARTDSAKADVNYQKFMQGQASHPGDFSRYMAKYADYQKFIQSQANKEGTAGNSKHKSDTLAKKDSASSDSSATASPALLAAETASQPPDFKTAGAVSADFQHFLQNRNFGNYTGALDRYMSTRGSEAAGDFGKYFSEYKNFEQNKGKHESADFQHYMKGYADAYATHVQERGDPVAPVTSAEGKSAGFQKYIAQYAGNYQKYMQAQPSAASTPTLLAAGSSVQPAEPTQEQQREEEKLQKERQRLHAELQSEKDRLGVELQTEHAQRQEEKEHLRAELQAEQQQTEEHQATQAHAKLAQPAVLVQSAGSKIVKVSPMFLCLLVAGGACALLEAYLSLPCVGVPFHLLKRCHRFLVPRVPMFFYSDPFLDSLPWREPAPAPTDDGWRFGEEDRKKNKPPDWVLEGDASRIHEGSKLDEACSGFAWRPGKDKCTQGIWLWSSPFVFRDQEGRKIAVLLMDTQGAWDDTMTKAQSATIFGLTALLSSKLIYNIQNRVEEDKLENMDYITTFAQTVCSDLPGKDAPFGHLELLVRDWVNYEDGFNIGECKEQMREHLDDHLSEKKVPEDAKPRVERLKSTFRSIAAWGLPHPGLKVTKPTYTGEIEAIDSDFLYLLDKFSDQFFGGGKFPQPSAPLGCEITTTGFQQVVMNFAKAFKENAQDMAIGLREAFVKVETVSVKEDLHKRFRETLKKLAPESRVLDPQQLRHDLDGLLSRIMEEFKLKLKPWRMPEGEEEQAFTDFQLVLSEAVHQRILVNDQQVEGGTLKLLASPVVGTGGYFLLAHHILCGLVMGGALYFDANKHAQSQSAELYDVKVLSSVWEDVQLWTIQRWKDLQAIQVALGRLNPQDAVQTLMKASKTAGAIATQAAAAANQAATSSNSNQQAHQG